EGRPSGVAMPVRRSSPAAARERVALVSVTEETLSAVAAGRITSGATAVAFEITFERPDQLPASSTVLIANQYVVAGWSPVTTKLCDDPGVTGAGGLATAVALRKFAAVIGDVGYRLAYRVGVPGKLAAPGAHAVRRAVYGGA